MSYNNSYIVCKPKPNNCNGSPCTCPKSELIRNGGFEIAGTSETFRDWSLDNFVLTGTFPSTNSYDGTFSAGFLTNRSPEVIRKTVRLFQNVTVTPGCLLQLSFAAEFGRAGTNFTDLDVIARVYYGNPDLGSSNQIDLIRIEIDYDEDQVLKISPSTQFSQGFTFYQKVADIPVPYNVTNVTVEFTFTALDTATDLDTRWFLDEVSLRAVSPICNC